MLLGSISQIVEHDTRLNPGALRDRVERLDPIQILRAVEDDGGITALPAKARAAAACKHRHIVAAARRDTVHQIVDCLRQDHADRHLAIVRGIGGVQCLRTGIEADFALEVRAQFRRELPCGSRRDAGISRGGRSIHFGSHRVARRVALLQFKPQAGARQIRRETAVQRQARTLEEHLLDAHVVVKILEVAHTGGGTPHVQMD